MPTYVTRAELADARKAIRREIEAAKLTGPAGPKGDPGPVGPPGPPGPPGECAGAPEPAPALGRRGVPVGIYNVNNQPMPASKYVYGLRFVLDEDTTLYRFISGFNLEGSDFLGGRTGYADGTGGTIFARLVECKPTGEPDLSRVLASEKVAAAARYAESKAAYGAPGLTQLLYFNMGGIVLRAGVPYAMTYQNVDSSPGSNWFSENSPTVKESVAGPNGLNNTDPNAPGAIAGLDPREAVAWSQDGGQTWAWGRHAGEGDTPGAYGGSATSDDGTRLPWYGWQTSPTAAPQSNQPYYAYKESGSYTLRVPAVQSATTLVSAGGYAPQGKSAGVITVRNLATGETAQTAELGSGLVEGALDHPVALLPGQDYEISNSGTVLKAEGDSFVQSTFRVGTGAWNFSTEGNEDDRAELYASGRSGATPPARVVVRRATLADPSLGGGPDSRGGTARGRAGTAAPRLLLVGRVAGAAAQPGAQVTVQLGFRGHWRAVGHTRLNGNARFHLVRRARLRGIRGDRHLRARALVNGVGRSRNVHVAVHR